MSDAATTPSTSSTFLPSIMGETVEVLADKSTTFHVHKSVLVQSPFFANALKPEWVSARDSKPIELQDVHQDTFAHYVQWLYSHQIDRTYDTLRWAKAYVLGEKFMDAEYQDTILEMMMLECEAELRFPTGEQINVIYDGTTENSPARKLLVDFFCVVGSELWMKGKDYGNTAPADFINDLLRALVVIKPPVAQVSSRPWVMDPSAYFIGSRKKAG